LIDGILTGEHPQLGPCRVAIGDVQSILLGDRPNRFHQYAFLKWKPRSALEPLFVDGEHDGHRTSSSLVGEELQIDVKTINSNDLLDFDEYRGKVLVLEFWASWCAPCMRSMPQLIEELSQFSKDQVELIAVNQGEDDATVSSVISTHGWKLQAALDTSGAAARSLGILSIPQTIVVDQRGVVSAVFLGASDRLHSEIVAEIKALLGE
jgi:thiol-disulfide isomerase/thioredoxin